MKRRAVDSWEDDLKQITIQDLPLVYQEASAGLWLSTQPPIVFESIKDQVFDLASLTKALFTAPKIFEFCSENGIPLSKPIKYFVSNALSQRLFDQLLNISLAELLSHTSGLPPWMNVYTECIGKELGDDHDKLIFHLNRMQSKSLEFRNEQYSDVGFLLLGLILEVETGKSLRSHLDDWNRLSGAQLEFSPTKRPVASTGYCALRKRELHGEVHDENCAFLGGATGHAGLFGSLEDVRAHLSWLLNSSKGSYFLHQNVLCRHALDSGRDGLLGLLQGVGEHIRGFGGGFSVGHLGFTGTAFWIEPTSRSFIIHLTNRVANGRRSRGIMDSRKRFCDFSGKLLLENKSHKF